nr:MAG TPA: hypothetical protein [Caudoviricetes sp.]
MYLYSKIFGSILLYSSQLHFLGICYILDIQTLF